MGKKNKHGSILHAHTYKQKNDLQRCFTSQQNTENETCFWLPSAMLCSHVVNPTIHYSTASSLNPVIYHNPGVWFEINNRAAKSNNTFWLKGSRDVKHSYRSALWADGTQWSNDRASNGAAAWRPPNCCPQGALQQYHIITWHEIQHETYCHSPETRRSCAKDHWKHWWHWELTIWLFQYPIDNLYCLVSEQLLLIHSDYSRELRHRSWTSSKGGLGSRMPSNTLWTLWGSNLDQTATHWTLRSLEPVSYRMAWCKHTCVFGGSIVSGIGCVQQEGTGFDPQYPQTYL